MSVITPEYLIGDFGRADANNFERIEWSDQKIKFLTDKAKGKEVLDIGCVCHNPKNYNSRFNVHRALKERAKVLTGLDLYKPGVDYLNEKGFNVVHGDACNFEFEKPFDLITAGDIVEHIGNLDGFFNSCFSNLKEDGSLLITTPNPWYWKIFVKAIIGKEIKPNPEHTLWLCPKTLEQISSRWGFRTVRVQYAYRYFKFNIDSIIHNLPLPQRLRLPSMYAELCKH